MLNHHAYAYTFTKFCEPARWQRLQMLGRACGWLFREAQRPGQMAVMSASRVLSDAYTFPAETTRVGSSNTSGLSVAAFRSISTSRRRNESASRAAPCT